MQKYNFSGKAKHRLTIGEGGNVADRQNEQKREKRTHQLSIHPGGLLEGIQQPQDKRKGKRGEGRISERKI